jgi:hypothetical protein
MSIQRLVLTIVMGASGSLGLLLAQPTPSTFTREISFPPVGVALTETMQVNLLNQSSNSAASCSGSVAFMNASGKAISGAGGNFTVTSGQITPITLTGAAANPSSSVRSEIRVVITVNESVPQSAPCSLVDSLETFDTVSGETHVFVSAPAPAQLTIVPFAAQ